MTDWSVAWYRDAGVDATVYRNVAVFLADRGDRPDDPVSDALRDGPLLSLAFSFARVGTVRFRLVADGDDWLRLVPTAGADDPEAALALLGRCIELFERFEFTLGLVGPAEMLADSGTREAATPTTAPDIPGAHADAGALRDALPAATSALFLDAETASAVGPARLAETPAVAATELLDGSAFLLGGPNLATDRLRLSAPAPRPTDDALPLRDAMSWALGWLDTAAAADRLAALLDAEDARTRVAAAETLALLRRTDTSARLRRALDDPDSAVRVAAVQALRGDDPANREALVAVLQEDDDPDVRRQAVRSLDDGSLVDTTLDALVAVAREDPEPSVRAAAVRAVGDDHDPAFHAASLDDDGPVRVAAAETLQLFADGTADANLVAVADDLVTALTDEDPAVRRAIADLLGSLPVPVAIDALCQAITDDPDPATRATAVSALGRQFVAGGGDNSDEVDTKQGDIDTDDPSTDADADDAEDSDIDTSDDDAGANDASATATGRHDAAVDALTSALTDTGTVRERVPEALGQVGDERATDPLIAALADEREAPVRRAAANALGNLGDDSGVDPLLDALADPDELVREQAAVSLGQLDDPQAVGPVVDLFDAAESDRLRYRLVSALSNFSGEAATTALEQLAETDDSEDVRTAAAWALDRRS